MNNLSNTGYKSNTAAEHTTKTIIIGTGFGGLAAAFRLKQQNDNDYIILERAGDVGGVWRDNQYPGCACDVQSNLYSFSFAQNPAWSREFSGRDEILQYLKRCARQFGLTSKIHFNTNVTRLEWREKDSEWLITTDRNEYRSRYIISGMGNLSDPKIPHIDGIENFKGKVFHSGNWPKDLQLDGKSVAVIGTGASAIQFIPEIQPLVANLHVYQRTAAWVMKRPDSAVNEVTRKRFASMPWLQRLARYKIYLKREWMACAFRNPVLMRVAQKHAMHHLNEAIKDPQLRKKLTPNYTLGCKRVLLSNDYYPAMAKPNVNLITSGPKRITERGIVGHDDIERQVDMIIFGTGFQAQELPYAHYIFGRSGSSLAEAWKDSPVSLAGTTVSGFPNLFLIHGPNTGTGHTSAVYMMEAQVEYSVRLIRYAERAGFGVLEAREEAQQRYVRWVDKLMLGTVWTSGGCQSWYLDKTGRNSILWPYYSFIFRNRILNIRSGEYEFRKPQRLTAA